MTTKGKKKARRKHVVRAHQVQVVELTKAGTSLRLEIYAHKEKIGTLEIGRGSLYWTGRSRQKSNRINWSKFADWMDRLAYD